LFAKVGDDDFFKAGLTSTRVTDAEVGVPGTVDADWKFLTDEKRDIGAFVNLGAVSTVGVGVVVAFIAFTVPGSGVVDTVTFGKVAIGTVGTSWSTRGEMSSVTFVDVFAVIAGVVEYVASFGTIACEPAVSVGAGGQEATKSNFLGAFVDVSATGWVFVVLRITRDCTWIAGTTFCFMINGITVVADITLATEPSWTVDANSGAMTVVGGISAFISVLTGISDGAVDFAASISW
jgi:hypothetical protein